MDEATGTTEYVGFWRRLLASLIDNATWLIGLSLLLGDALGALYDESPEAAGVAVFILLSLWFNYFAFCEWRWGQTIGKNATGIIVTSLDGGSISFGQASIRNLLRIVDLFLIGPIMVATTKRHQRLGDKLAGTVVVRRRPQPRAAPDPPPAVVAGESWQRISGGSDAATTADAPAGEPAAGGDPRPEGLRGRLPEINWTPRDTAWGLIGGLLLGALVAPLLVLPFDPDLSSEGALLAAQALLGASLLLVSVGIASNWRFKPLREALGRLGLRRFRLSALGWMLLAMLTYYVLAAVFAALVLEPEQEDIGGELGVGDDALVIAILAIVLIGVVAPLSEELFFRGFVFSGLRSRFSLWPAALIAGLVFGLVHAPTGITTVVPLAALGVVLSWLYDRTGSLWPCVIAHMINNGLALALLS